MLSRFLKIPYRRRRRRASHFSHFNQRNPVFILVKTMAMFKALSFLFFLSCFEIHGTIAAAVNSSFSFDGFANSSTFDKNVALFGDSKLVKDSSSIQLTDSVSGSVGRVVYKKPIKLFQGKESSNSLSFSSSFFFSMPNEPDDVMAFVMVPTSLDLGLFGKKGNNSSSSALGFLFEHAKNETVVAFEFDISKRGNYARILIGRPEISEIRNLSFEGDLMMDNGGRLNCMIEYEALSKRMMVRFRKPGSVKMLDPFFYFSVDLGELWNGGEFVVGLSSANGNSSNAHLLHSWSFEIRQPTPVWMHSLPLEPNQAIEADVSTEGEEGVERNECIWRMFGVWCSVWSLRSDGGFVSLDNMWSTAVNGGGGTGGMSGERDECWGGWY